MDHWKELFRRKRHLLRHKTALHAFKSLELVRTLHLCVSTFKLFTSTTSFAKQFSRNACIWFPCTMFCCMTLQFILTLIQVSLPEPPHRVLSAQMWWSCVPWIQTLTVVVWGGSLFSLHLGALKVKSSLALSVREYGTHPWLCTPCLCVSFNHISQL